MTNAVYKQTTGPIEIEARPFFLESESSPADHIYVWAYRISIANRGDEPLKLTHRHWRITDASGVTNIVEGEGVVGEQPLIQPGTKFEYTSGVPLKTPCGMMTGHYIILSQDGRTFEAAIPGFSLDSPFEQRRVN